MKKRLIGFGAIAITTLIAAVGLQVSYAFAEGDSSDTSGNWDWCPAGYFCVASLTNGGGTHAWFKIGAHDLQTDVRGVVNNNISSYKNNTNVTCDNSDSNCDNNNNGNCGNSDNNNGNGCVAYIYDQPNYQGACAYENPGDTINSSGRMNNIVSSIRVSSSDTYDSQYCSTTNLHTRRHSSGSSISFY